MLWSRNLLTSFGAAGIAAAAGACSTAAAQVVSLQSYNVDINQTSVSGLSSGGYMAVQFDVAFSSILRGAGVVAGGPYYCAQGSLMAATSTCSCVFGCFGQSSTNVAQLITITDRNAGRGLIDGTRNLANHRIWMFSGTSDTVVPQRIMNDLFTYYRHYIDAANISYKNDIAAEHAMPTDYFGNPCMTRNDPFINNCNYDGAGQLLRWIYGNLNPKNTGQLGGAFINFNQGEFIDQPNDHGMASDGWLYVPVNCGNRQVCTLHVVFHGCKQYETYRYSAGGAGLVTFSTTYVRNTGYNKWADTNNIIVLYPQATASSQNPNGCWDWWGYDDPNYAAKSGRQMAAVKRMIDRIVSGHSGLSAPADLQTTAVSDTSVSLSWSPVASASGFNVYRDRNKAAGSPVTATSFTDTGLSPGNTYRYTVAAIDSAGVEAKLSCWASSSERGPKSGTSRDSGGDGYTDQYGNTTGWVGSKYISTYSDGYGGMTGTIGNKLISTYEDGYGNTRGTIGRDRINLYTDPSGTTIGTIGRRRLKCYTDRFRTTTCN